jgi:hypothetical protein
MEFNPKLEHYDKLLKSFYDNDLITNNTFFSSLRLSGSTVLHFFYTVSSPLRKQKFCKARDTLTLRH